MCEPLSLVATVVGLTKAATSIFISLSSSLSQYREAPEDCRRVHDEVNNFCKVLGQLQTFILGTNQAQTSRTNLIMVDQVVATLAACVTTFSELDTYAKALEVQTHPDTWTRLKWLRACDGVANVLSRLQRHNTCLSVMLSMLTW